MAETLDVYRDWLGVKETERPLDYYRLLRLEKFDDDQDRIRRHYRKLNSHVRKFASGTYASESQQLLNELARAMLCLTDLQRKSEYDESLGRVRCGVGGCLREVAACIAGVPTECLPGPANDEVCNGSKACMVLWCPGDSGTGGSRARSWQHAMPARTRFRIWDCAWVCRSW